MRDEKEFFLPVDGVKLHMKLAFPDVVKDVYPMMIVVHGLTGDMEEEHLIGVADACHRAGFATLRVELFGHGKSEGSFTDHTVMHWVTELMQIIDYAGSLDFVSDLYLTGHSQGGAAIILAAGFKPEPLKAIIPLSPAVSLKEIAMTGQWREMSFDPKNIPKRLPFHDDYILSGNYMRTWQMLPMEEAIRRFDKPVLIIHGTADESIAYHYGAELADKFPNAKLVTVEGDDHCYNYHLPVVTQAVYDFLMTF